MNNGIYADIESETPEKLYSKEILDYSFEIFKNASDLRFWIVGVLKRTAWNENFQSNCA